MKGIKFIQMFETKGGSELVFLGQLDILEDLEFDDVVKRIAQPNGHKGKWIKEERPKDFSVIWKPPHICSACGEEAEVLQAGGGVEFLSNYCPNCGADMRGKE